MELIVRHHSLNGHQVVTLDGVVDVASLPALHDHLLRATRDHGGGELVVDLDAVEAIDDSGLGLLLGAAGRCRAAGGELVVVVSSDRMRERFSLTGLDRAVEVRPRLT